MLRFGLCNYDVVFNECKIDGHVWSPGFEYPECIFVETLTFDGEASVVSPEFGPNQVVITKQGSITRNEPNGSDSSSTATLSANFGDGSSLVVNATNDAESEVQVDIVSGAAAVSFTDSYRFEGLPLKFYH